MGIEDKPGRFSESFFKHPLYHNIRNFLGVQDLVVSFKTSRCKWQRCTFCAIPSRAPESEVSVGDIKSQIDWVFNVYEPRLPSIGQFSFGNEGSILDELTFPAEAFGHLLERVRSAGSGRVLSLETRPEFVTRARLTRIQDQIRGNTLDVTVGLETTDDLIRNKILRKGISKRLFEDMVALLGRLGVRLTCYVMVKPSPYMSEYEGIREAEVTVRYLRELTRESGVDLIVYLNPTYIARGTSMATIMHEQGYRPPNISSVRTVAQLCCSLKIPCYTGLWSEGLAEPEGAYSVEDPLEKRARGTLKLFNQTKDPNTVFSTLL